MKLLATALPLREGQITFGDLDLNGSSITQIRGIIGYLPQRFEVMNLSTVKRNVGYAAWAHGLSGDELDAAVANALELFDLSDRAKSQACSLSGGMRQRLGLACALVHRPSVVAHC
jgi:ABC-2 type transport system ATP-binding protein